MDMIGLNSMALTGKVPFAGYRPMYMTAFTEYLKKLNIVHINIYILLKITEYRQVSDCVFNDWRKKDFKDLSLICTQKGQNCMQFWVV